jgi:prostaglandin-endoperoxide synthase 2
MPHQRDRSKDTLLDRLQAHVLQNYEPVWRLIEAIGPLQRLVNRFLINRAVKCTRNRPHQFGTSSDYTTWRTLTDRAHYARHLGAEDPPAGIPAPEALVALFRRPQGGGVVCPKSTLLFPAFAQYLTDGFLRTDMNARTRTTSNHEIDLSPLYGRTAAQTDALRTRDETPGQRGRLRSQVIDGEEYPPLLFEPGGRVIAAPFRDPMGQPILDLPLGWHDDQDGHARQLFAVGGDRANATPLVAMLNTLFLREHNRIAGELERRNASWDDTRVFETARNMVIVIFIKIVIEEYINHISPLCFRLRAQPQVVWGASWNRPNWMTVEFALLYRWHPMVPNAITWGDRSVPGEEMVLDNRFLTGLGMARALAATAGQNAYALGLFNTAGFLLGVEQKGIRQGQEQRLRRYNDYRFGMGMPKLDRFEEVTGDPARIAALREAFGSVERMDYFVGLFAEDVNPNTPMPSLIGRMVALDAFSQALTNPLLSQHVFNEATFSAWGFEEIGKPQTLAAILARTTPGGLPAGFDLGAVRMTRADWRRG